MYVRNKKVITTNIVPLRLENGRVASQHFEVAAALHYYFASVFTVKDTNEIQEITRVQPT